MDVGMLQVREVAVCRAVRHDGDVAQNGVELSRTLRFRIRLAELLLTSGLWEKGDDTVLLMRRILGQVRRCQLVAWSIIHGILRKMIANRES